MNKHEYIGAIAELMLMNARLKAAIVAQNRTEARLLAQLHPKKKRKGLILKAL